MMVSVSSKCLAKNIRQLTFSSLFVFIVIDSSFASEIQFNTDVLDLKDRDNIDLNRFSRKDFILPGNYSLTINLNSVSMPEREITFLAPENDPDGSMACLTPELISQLGLTRDATKKLVWFHNNQCLDPSSVPGMDIKPDLSTSSLMLNVPQALLEYNAPDWDPPSRWENGLSGIMADYSLYGQSSHQAGADDEQSFSGHGVVGANIGAWRFRTDWQGRYDQDNAEQQSKAHELDMTRFYAYRALPQIASKIILGEDYLSSDLFDSFRFSGVSLTSDNNMRPPALRGYAPEVSGIARTNARVTISQQGRVIKEVSVAAGAFRIQDLSSAITGELNVVVEEADGRVQRFTVDTANVPYLTRPGQINYKTAIGRPSELDHKSSGPFFAMGEFSWGVSSGWSLIGGSILSDSYKALNTGIGRDLYSLGALSFDVTQSFARLPGKELRSGKSYRLNYAKTFESFDNDIQLGAYRFSDDGYLSMGEYLNYLQGHNLSGRSKETYTIITRQRFDSLGFDVSLNYNRHTFWDRESENRYTLNLGRNFDIGSFRNVYVNLYGQRHQSGNSRDNSLNLTVSMPFGASGNISYDGNYSDGRTSNGVNYYNRLKDGDSYRLGVRGNENHTSFNGNYNHENTYASLNASASYQSDRYSTASLSVEGGATLTAEGGALHRTGMLGGTRILVDTDGVEGVPVSGYGKSVFSNSYGKAVVGNVNSYYRNSIRIDVDKLAENAEASQTVVQGTLTEGAIGYRRFEVIKGEKIMAVVRMPDGKYPPFGATVVNEKNQETGIVTDEGALYLTGINPNQDMVVQWGENQRCSIMLPAELPDELGTLVPLTCITSDKSLQLQPASLSQK